MAHILEFRILRKKGLQASGAAFLTPPGVTCREAGVAWEVRALGGTITPVCAADYDFFTQIGLALRSAAWNLYHMAIPNKWIRAVLLKEHWNTQPDPLHIPFNSVPSLETQVDEGSGGDDDESNMSSEVLTMPTTLKKSSRQRADVVVHTPSRRPGQNWNKQRNIRKRFSRKGFKILRLGLQRRTITQAVPSTDIL